MREPNPEHRREGVRSGADGHNRHCSKLFGTQVGEGAQLVWVRYLSNTFGGKGSTVEPLIEIVVHLCLKGSYPIASSFFISLVRQEIRVEYFQGDSASQRRVVDNTGIIIDRRSQRPLSCEVIVSRGKLGLLRPEHADGNSLARVAVKIAQEQFHRCLGAHKARLAGRLVNGRDAKAYHRVVHLFVVNSRECPLAVVIVQKIELPKGMEQAVVVLTFAVNGSAAVAREIDRNERVVISDLHPAWGRVGTSKVCELHELADSGFRIDWIPIDGA
mmetsp:Transcript_17164/g.38480  ORF Transcript_17164/g.38480 Transcript_17164/m.38480 type:complete len:273 (-) Transcript_17164:167-985(-)